jgi:FxLD family lantipeptide
MTSLASLLDLAPPGLADDGEFLLDLRVIESGSPLAVVSCATDDQCGSTCAPSACSTSSNDPS